MAERRSKGGNLKTGLLSEELSVRECRRFFNRHFPAFSELDDEIILGAASSLPSLLQEGEERFWPGFITEEKLSWLKEWFSGSTQVDVAQSHGLSRNKIHWTMDKLGIRLRENFSEEEVLSGRLDPAISEEMIRRREKELGGRILAHGYPDIDVDQLALEQVQLIIDKIAAAHPNKKSAGWLIRYYGGESVTEIAKEVSKAAGTVERAIAKLMQSVGRHIPQEKLTAAASSESPAEDLDKLLNILSSIAQNGWLAVGRTPRERSGSGERPQISAEEKLERARKVLSIAWPEADLEQLDLSQIEILFRNFVPSLRNRKQATTLLRIQRGETMHSVARQTGISDETIRWWRNSAMQKLAKAASIEEVIAALKSVNSNEELKRLFQNVSTSHLPPVLHSGKSEEHFAFWDGVKKELAATTQRTRYIDEDISKGVDEILEELGVEIPEKGPSPIPHRKVRPRTATSLDGID